MFKTDGSASRDWTIHGEPAPAHPSYRLIPALRLLHVTRLSEEVNDTRVSGSQLKAWEATVAGVRDLVDQENEQDMRATLRSICKQVLDRSTKTLCEFAKTRREDYAWHCLETFWREEHDVSRAVIDSIDRAIEF